MQNNFKKDTTVKHIIKESKKSPTDIFELNDGTIVVNGMLFENRVAFDKIHRKAKRKIKRDAFFKRLRLKM